ncbi:MAG: protein kinase [Fimbriiglobus sp.]|jgi:tetratricopeptide (TPR) repeat protein|nr:protein kinase [Fimbriiglobus sp.]
MIAPPPADLTQLANEIQEKWAAGDPPDALAALAAHPELRACKPLVVELAYEEFCLRAEAGAPLHATEFAARFPFAESVARLLCVHSMLGRQGSFGQARRPTFELYPGDEVDGRIVLRRLGRGGFSDVYLMRNPALGGRVEVLKVSTRGAQEAHTLGPLAHPHLMPVHQALTVRGHPAVLFPYCGQATGETLSERAEVEQPSPGWLLRVAGECPTGDPPVTDPPPFPIRPWMPHPQAVLHIAAATADALCYLHAHGVAHRDLKPANLLLGPTGFPYLLDFNLADDRTCGRAGGTAAYAPPEVLANLADPTSPPTDGRAADVFSFAVTIFELHFARHPYLTREVLSHITPTSLSQAASAAARTVAAARPTMPSAARRLLLAALAADPAARPTAEALAHALTAAINRRHWARWATVGTAAVAVALGGWVTVGNQSLAEPLAQGQWLVQKGQPETAIVAFEQAASQDSTGQAAEWLGYCHLQVGNPSIANTHLVRAEQLGRKTVSVYANRAAARLTVMSAAEAAADASAALAIDPHCQQARLTHALATFRMRGMSGVVDRAAVAHLEQLVQEEAKHCGLWLTLAEARVRVQDPTPADFDRAIEAVGLALQHGQPRNSIARNRVFLDALKDDPRFLAALETPRLQRANSHPGAVCPK